MLEQGVVGTAVLAVIPLHMQEDRLERRQVVFGKCSRIRRVAGADVHRARIGLGRLQQAPLIIREGTAGIGHHEPVGQPAHRILHDHLVPVVKQHLFGAFLRAAGDEVGGGGLTQEPGEAVGITGLEVF